MVSGLLRGSDAFVIKYTPKSEVGHPLASRGAGLLSGSQGADKVPKPRACFMTSTKVRSRLPQSLTQLILIPILEPALALPEADATVIVADWVAVPPIPVQVNV